MDDPARQQLNCAAQAGGGLYQDAHSAQELKNALDNVHQQVIKESTLFEGQIAYTGADYNIYVLRGSSLKPIQITFNGSDTYHNDSPKWSPDGRKLAYLGGQPSDNANPGPAALFITDPDNNRPRKVVDGIYKGIDWSPDGKSIIFDHSFNIAVDTTGKGIGWVDVNTGAVTNIVPPQKDIREWNPEWSPNGQWIKFYGFFEDGMGPSSIYKVSNGEISSFGSNVFGTENIIPDYIRWSQDGDHLIFTNGGQGMGNYYTKLYMASPSGKNVQQIFDLQSITTGSIITGDIIWTPDGKQLAFGLGPESSNGGLNSSGTMFINADGSSPKRMTGSGLPLAFSPGGHQLLLNNGGVDNVDEMMIYDLDTQKVINTGVQFRDRWWDEGGRDWGLLPTSTSDAQPLIKETQVLAEASPTPVVIPTATAIPPTPTPQPGVGTMRVSEKDGMKQMYVPAGEFQMGLNEAQFQLIYTSCIDSGFQNSECQTWYDQEKPAHMVYLDVFWIDQTIITNGMYAKCVSAGICAPSLCNGDNCSNGDQQPVVGIDWNQAKAYCEWAGRRLPTEAEWEKAARGTDGRIYPWGNQAPNSRFLNINRNIGNSTNVGLYPEGASPFGALDMVGNVAQWVADFYDGGYYSSSPARNPQGPSSGSSRGVRGGLWGGFDNNARSTFRSNSDQDFQGSGVIGFRCAQSAAP